MEWRQFVMHLESLPADRVEAVLTRHGAEAITLTDAADQPLLEPAPGETPLWEQACITGLFAMDFDFPALREDLLRSLGLTALPCWRIETLADRAWEREWLKDFQPMRFGRRLWVSPGDQPVTAADAVVVQLDPGLAFGTGTHATTALCLEWLDGLSLDGRRVLDFGCGSGILAIASVLLGARSAVALDIDPQALIATRSNAQRNEVQDRITTVDDPACAGYDFDVIVANVLAGPLKVNASTICSRLGPAGALALSGILEHQAAEVADAYHAWIEFDAPAVKGHWVRLAGHNASAIRERI